MKVKRLGLPKIMAISIAFLMVVVGLVLSRVPGDREAVASPDGAAPTASEALPQAEDDSAVSEPPQAEVVAAPAELDDADRGGDAPRQPTGPKPSSARRSTPPVSARSTQTSQSGAARSLPPLPPPNWGAVSTPQQPIGPPPHVLWLSGVIGGEPRVAVLRRGDNRYVVSEGDVFEESYRVVQISSNSVTLQRSGRKQTLRVGQY